MSPTIGKSFDCLAFKRKVQAEIYEEVKNQSPQRQIEYFRRRAETGPFRELAIKLRQQAGNQHHSPRR